MILVGIGANLAGPDGRSPLAVCAAAVLDIARWPGVRLVSRSRWYRSAPVPASDQSDYINAVARLDASGLGMTPESLLAALHAIEARHGRVRSTPNAARSLDLDLIDMDGIIREAPDPILPHPRAHERAFVLLPILDVAPDWRHPRSGLSVRSLLERVDRSGIRDGSALD